MLGVWMDLGNLALETSIIKFSQRELKETSLIKTSRWSREVSLIQSSSQLKERFMEWVWIKMDRSVLGTHSRSLIMNDERKLRRNESRLRKRKRGLKNYLQFNSINQRKIRKITQLRKKSKRIKSYWKRLKRSWNLYIRTSSMNQWVMPCLLFLKNCLYKMQCFVLLESISAM